MLGCVYVEVPLCKPLMNDDEGPPYGYSVQGLKFSNPGGLWGVKGGTWPPTYVKIGPF